MVVRLVNRLIVGWFRLVSCYAGLVRISRFMIGCCLM